MVDVKLRIAAIEAQVPAMSGELQRFLDLVWTHRTGILQTGPGSGGVLYMLYARRPRAPHAAAPATRASVLDFLRRMQPLVQGLGQPDWVQQSSEDDPETLEELLDLFQYFGGKTDQDSVDTVAYYVDHAARTFYHLPAEAWGPAQARIYLNVPVLCGVEVMRFVVQDLRIHCPDVMKAKLAGPCNTGADRIVIWLTALDRAPAVLRRIAAFQRNFGAFFLDGVPRLCQQAMWEGQPLRGVGLAVEPPAKDGVPISYGKSRTGPIFDALQQLFQRHPDWAALHGAPAMAAKRLFVTEALTALRRAGIDPSQIFR